MADEARRTYDAVVFGATGFTGRLVALFVARSPSFANRKWAVAGRSASKLEAVRGEAGGVPDAVVADVGDAASLDAMARSARVVINCVGPFRFHGLPVVAACASAGTHYVDITGEPSFIERAMLEHHEAAKASGALIVPTCGFDSVPCDMGVVHAERVFRRRHPGLGAPAAVEGFLRVEADEGLAGHYATYESAVHGVATADELRATRKELRSVMTRGGQLRVRHPDQSKAPQLRSAPHFEERVGQYVAPFPGADAAVVRNSQLLRAALRPDEEQPRHAQYFCTPGALTMFQTAVFGGMMKAMAPWSWTRSLLLSYPGFFSFGAFSHEGPTDEQLAATRFEITFVATAADGATVSRTRVRGPEPGYVATPALVVGCALTILEELDTLEYRAGVVTPAAAFASSTLIERLARDGVFFEEVEEKEEEEEMEK